MADIIKIDPVTRLEGHLKVELETTGGYVSDAWSSGLMFRGFENLLVGKDARDAAQITQRVCGVCPTSHAMAACLAMEDLAGIQVPDNARIVRNLILGADYLHSHILHFYHLSLPSYVKFDGGLLGMSPWTPDYAVESKLSPDGNQRLVSSYVQALAARREAHEMGAILGGKLPHTAAYEFGGVTTAPKAEDIDKFRVILNRVSSFVDTVYVPDVELLAGAYPEYFEIGRGYGSLISFGVFDEDAAGTTKLLARGRWADGATEVQEILLQDIVEETDYSWYAGPGGLNPADGVTEPEPDKDGGYSWLKAPRYAGVPYEAGPLARMWVNGDYREGISVMDRHRARALEASKIAHAMERWLGELDLAAPFFTDETLPATGSGVGLTEAPRGALGHWLSVGGGPVSRYQILTPTCWNCSPRDGDGQRGPVEEALVGAPVYSDAPSLGALRVVQSFDPCLACSVH